MYEAFKGTTCVASANMQPSANFFHRPMILDRETKMAHTSSPVIGSNEPTAPGQTTNEASISHHSAPARPQAAGELHPTSTSSLQSARLFTPTTHNTTFPRLRFRRGPHFFPQHSGSAQLHLPTTGLLLLPLAMAHPGQPYIERRNERGDVFLDYGCTPDQLTAELCFASGDSDDTEHDDIDDGRGEGLSGQFAGLGLGDANTGTREPRIRRHSDQNDSTIRTGRNLQWEMDNLPIDSTRRRRVHIGNIFRPSSGIQSETENLPSEETDWPSNEQPADESTPNQGRLPNEHYALVDFQRAYKLLELPIVDDVDGENQRQMVQLAVNFIFRTLPWLNHIREDLKQLGDLYDAHSLAEQFYVEYGAAIWGLGAVGDRERDDERLARLESFFNALRTQDSTRDEAEAEAIGENPLEQLMHLRRTAVAATRVIPRGTRADGSLSALYAALEIQSADT